MQPNTHANTDFHLFGVGKLCTGMCGWWYLCQVTSVTVSDDAQL